MGSTDTGDYFPEGYNRENEVAFSEGMGGSQAMLGGGQKGPQLPGMENLGADAVVQGGIAVSDEIPAGMQFIASSVPDGTVEFSVGSTSGTFRGVGHAPCLLSVGCCDDLLVGGVYASDHGLCVPWCTHTSRYNL